MRYGMAPSLTLAALLALPLAAPADDALSSRPPAAESAVARFRSSHPGVGLSERAGRVVRVFGRAFSEGLTAEQSAERFRTGQAALFAAEPQDLVPDEDAWGRPVLYLPDEDRYRFSAFAYRQARGGVPVFRSRLVLLVRNDPGFPLVLAAADLRDLDDLPVDPATLPPADPSVLLVTAEAQFGPDVQITSVDGVIWAGVDDESPTPRLAHRTFVASGVRRWLMVTDAFTGELLFQEDRLHTVEITGTLHGLVTEGIGSEQCEDELPVPLPYAPIMVANVTVYTDVDGQYSVPVHGTEPLNVTASLAGLWFDVINAGGAEVSSSVMVTPPGVGELTLNESNTALERAEVNAYLAANEIRDAVLAVNPAYPSLDEGALPVHVNRTDYLCPGNAWYSPDEQSINFCQAGGGHPNTAWSSVVYHEYGHHLIAVSGSGQGAYGEGMGDALSVVMLDAPEIGLGFYGSCGGALRSADNTCQYQESGCSTCGSSNHSCGQLLSGCVWDLRNELLAVDPVGYLDTLTSLVVNSILLHVGSGIEPQIVVDFLTLDDDNGELADGSPHYAQITAAFAAHGMPAPPLAPLGFRFPEGLPPNVSPFDPAPVRVEVYSIGGEAEPGTGMLHVSDSGVAGTFVAIPMEPVGPNVYDATFPAGSCGTLSHYYFSAQTVDDEQGVWPLAAPVDTATVVTATEVVTTFAEDFESVGGWTIENDGISDGAWEFGIPAGGGDRGDPVTDADGSGSCALTDNVDGNSDVDNGSTTLVSPAMDATVGTAFVSYWRWFSNSSGPGPFLDPFVVQVSSDDGASWVDLEVVGPDGDEVSGGWFFRQFRIDEFVAPTDQLRVRFVASDTGTPSIIEAAVDGLMVRGYECVDRPACPSDVNGDGTVDVDDLVAVILAWGERDPATDVTGDGLVDVDDLVTVVLDWGPCE